MHAAADEIIDYCMLQRLPHVAMQTGITGEAEQFRYDVTMMRASKRYRATEAEAAMSGDAEDFGVGRIIWLLFRKWVGR